MVFHNAVPRDPKVESWLAQRPDAVGDIARHWFGVVRGCGDDIQELLHDGYPTACVSGAAFAYIGAFKAHVNIGFFHGNQLPDPSGLLEGTGKFMRHVKLRPQQHIDAEAVANLVKSAYLDIQERLEQQ